MQNRSESPHLTAPSGFRARVRFLRLFPVIVGTSIALLAVAELAAWFLNSDFLRTVLPRSGSMKPGTALGFVVCGLAIVMLATSRRRIIAILSGVLIALGGAGIAASVFGADFASFSPVSGPEDNSLRSTFGGMLPTSAISFALLGVGIAAGLSRSSLGRHTAFAVFATVLTLAFGNLIGYLYEAPFLYFHAGPIRSAEVHSPIAFALAALACLSAHPSVVLGELFIPESMAGANYRRLFPAAVLVPIAIGAAALVGLGNRYGVQGAVALTALGSSVAIALLVTVTHLLLSRSEESLRLEDRALAAARTGVVITNRRLEDEPIVWVNPAFTSITGFGRDEVVGRNCRILNAGVAGNDEALERIRATLRDETTCQIELRNRRKDGSLFWNSLSLAPVYDGVGMVSHYVGFIEDISADIQREQRLTEALNELNRTTRAMDSFVRIMSHELRGPLNAAATWVSLIEMESSPEILQQGIAAIRQSIDDQARLISDLVDATQAASPSLELSLEAIDIIEVLNFLLDEWAPRVSESGLTLVRNVPSGRCEIMGDRVRLRQVFGNLLNNASKYTPTGGRISVSLYEASDHVIVKVSDTGVGLTHDQLEQVFDPYWRGTKKIKGLGLGLAIVKSLVNGHFGKITASSAGPDKGAEFTVVLPLKRSTAAA